MRADGVEMRNKKTGPAWLQRRPSDLKAEQAALKKALKEKERLDKAERRKSSEVTSPKSKTPSNSSRASFSFDFEIPAVAKPKNAYVAPRNDCTCLPTCTCPDCKSSKLEDKMLENKRHEQMNTSLMMRAVSPNATSPDKFQGTEEAPVLFTSPQAQREEYLKQVKTVRASFDARPLSQAFDASAIPDDHASEARVQWEQKVKMRAEKESVFNARASTKSKMAYIKDTQDTASSSSKAILKMRRQSSGAELDGWAEDLQGEANHRKSLVINDPGHFVEDWAGYTPDERKLAEAKIAGQAKGAVLQEVEQHMAQPEKHRREHLLLDLKAEEDEKQRVQKEKEDAERNAMLIESLRQAAIKAERDEEERNQSEKKALVRRNSKKFDEMLGGQPN